MQLFGSSNNGFDQNKLVDTVDRLDSDKNGISLEELKKNSRWHTEQLMANLRSAAAELRAEKNPAPEKVAALRKTIERLAALNEMKAKQEAEIRSLYGGELKDFFELFAEIRERLNALKEDVAPAPVQAKAEAVAAKPAVAPADAKAPKAAAEKAPATLSQKIEFLTADESAFKSSDGKRSTVFGRDQLSELLGRKEIVGGELDFDRLMLRLADAPLNLENPEEAKSVRRKFLATLSLRLRTFSELYAKLGMDIDGPEAKGGGGLIHILQGKEDVLVRRILDATAAVNAKKEGKDAGFSIGLNDIIETLAGIGLGFILGPVYLDWRRREDIAGKEIRTGKKSDPLSWKSSQSATNVEFRIAPAVRIFGLALGINAEVDVNLKDRQAAIIGKIEEAAAELDKILNLETGVVDISKVPKEYAADAAEFKRNFEAMQTGDPVADAVLTKAMRDGYLLELAKALINDDKGAGFKGVGGGLTLLFGFLPIRAYVKANFEHLSSDIRPGQMNGSAALDSIKIGERSLEQMGISKTYEIGSGYVYRIDPARGYKIQDRTDLKPETPYEFRSKNELYFAHFESVSDTYVKGSKPEQTLIVSPTPIGAAKDVPVSKEDAPAIYEAKSNDPLRNEVMAAMREVRSVDIRQKYTGFQRLQESISKAYVSGNPDDAFKLLPTVRMNGKRPLAALAKAHAKDSPADKRELLSMILQETAGDWRVRQFDAIKTDKKAFADFVERTGYRGTQKDLKLSDIVSAWDLGGTFDRNFIDKTGLSKVSKQDQEAAAAAIGTARTAFSKDLGKLDSINNNTRTITKAIGFVNFHQVAVSSDGKTYKRFQDVVPVTGTVKAVNVEPTKFENESIRRELVARTPDFVLKSLLETINAQAEKVGAPKISTLDEVRKLLINNGKKGEGAFRPDIELTSELAYTRFAKCLNDTYLIQNIKLCVTGPNGRGPTCDPDIPDVVPSRLAAPTGVDENAATDFGIGLTTAGKKHDKKDKPTDNGNGNTTPGHEVVGTTPGSNATPPVGTINPGTGTTVGNGFSPGG